LKQLRKRFFKDSRSRLVALAGIALIAPDALAPQRKIGQSKENPDFLQAFRRREFFFQD
jgi:hypothetical protein